MPALSSSLSFSWLFLFAVVLPARSFRATVAQCIYVPRNIDRCTTVQHVAPFDKINLENKTNSWLRDELGGGLSSCIVAGASSSGKGRVKLTLSCYREGSCLERTTMVGAYKNLIVRNIANSKILPADILALNQTVPTRSCPTSVQGEQDLFSIQLIYRNISGFYFPDDKKESIFYKSPFYDNEPPSLTYHYSEFSYKYQETLVGASDLPKINSENPSFWAWPRSKLPVQQKDLYKKEMLKEVESLPFTQKKFYQKKRAENWRKDWVDRVNCLISTRYSIFEKVNTTCQDWVKAYSKKIRDLQQEFEKNQEEQKKALNSFSSYSYEAKKVAESLALSSKISLKEQLKEQYESLLERAQYHEKGSQFLKKESDKLKSNINWVHSRIKLWGGWKTLSFLRMGDHKKKVSDDWSHEKIYKLLVHLNANPCDKDPKQLESLYNSVEEKDLPFVKGERLKSEELLCMISEMKAWTVEWHSSLIAGKE